MDNSSEAAALPTPPGSPTCADVAGEGNEALANLDDFNAWTESDAVNDQLIRDSQQQIDNEIATKFPLVSESIPIDLLHHDYDAEDLVYQQKVEDLKQNYGSMRKTRPDGNCFYRAFIFGYLESLFNDLDEQHRFLELCSVTRKGIADVLGFQDFTIDEFYEYFSDITTMITEGKIQTADQLMAELDQPAVYDNIVVYLRLLTSYYLQKESDFFSAFIEGSGQIGDFCKREVEPMYKESDHIHIIALSSVFEVTVRIVYMDRGAGGKVNEHDFNPLKVEGPPKDPRVHLLYRPGHYDVLYFRTAEQPPPLLQNGNAVPSSPRHLQQPLSPAVASVVPGSPARPYQEPDCSSSSDAVAASPANGGGNPLSPLLQQPLSPRSPAQHEELNSTQPDL